MRYIVVPTVFVGLLASTATLEADVVAQWRFEGYRDSGGDFVASPPAGTPVPAGDFDPLVDETGNNPLRTFSAEPDDTRPRFTDAVAFGTVPQSGAANTRSLDFTPNQDLYAAGKPLSTVDFNQFTIEAVFNPDSIDAFQNLVGKDGKPLTDSPLAPLQFKIRNDNDLLQIEILDAAGEGQQVSSIEPVTPDQWYAAAAVSDGSTLSLYLDSFDGAGYVLQGTTEISGGLIESDGTWTVGRGMYNGGLADWYDGQIDEIRISDNALLPSQFLATVIPEPGSAALLLAGGLALIRRRR